MQQARPAQRRRRIVTVIVATLVLVSPAYGQSAAPPVRWRPCPSDGPLTGLQCATVSVPLDHGAPDGEHITIAISRRRHTTNPSLGVVFTNPGGPGGEGRSLAQVGGNLDPRVADRYDWIGIDTRGVGASRPALACSPRILASPAPPNTALGAWERRARSYAAACAATPSARLLPHMTTADIARDMDLVRAALGVERINYYGASYGTILGQVYASLHPERVERMILDGVGDANVSFHALNRSQRATFEANHRAFLVWVARHSAAFGLGRNPTTIRARLNARLAKLWRNPPASGPRAGDVEFTLLQNGYSTMLWPVTGTALSIWLRTGDRRGFAPLPRSDNAVATYLAVECGETPSPDWAQMVAEARVDARTAPLGTWLNLFDNAPCAFWPVPPAGREPIDGSRVAAPILLISDTGDAATPYSGALAVRTAFPTSRLIAVRGGLDHSAALVAGTCTRRAVEAFLRTGALPPRRPGVGADRVCPPSPPPPVPDLPG